MIQNIKNAAGFGKKENKVPTTADLVSILQSSLEAINNLVTFIDSSSLKNSRRVLRSIKEATQSTVKAIGYISGCLTQVNVELQKLNASARLNALSTLVTDPVGFIKAVRSNQPVSTVQRLPLEEFLNLIMVVSSMSQLKVNLIGIIKSSIALRIAIRHLFGINKYLNRKARFVRPLDKVAIASIQQTKETWTLLSDSQQAMQMFYQQASKMNFLKLWWNINKLFSVYYLIFDGVNNIYSMIVGRRSRLKFKIFGKEFTTRPTHLKSIANIAKKILLFKLLIRQFNDILITSVELFTSIYTIGKMSRLRIRNGLNIFEVTLERLKEIVCNRRALTPKMKTKLGTMIPLLGMYVIITSLAAVIAKNIIYLGQNDKNIRKGIAAFSLIFNDRAGKKILGIQTGIGKATSLMSIIMGIDTKKSVLNKLVGVLKVTALIMVVTLTLFPVCIALAIIGGYKRLIKKGIKAVGYAINKMVEILIENDKLKGLKYKTIWDRASIVMVMSGLFLAVAGEISVIGLMTPALVMATIAIISIGVVIGIMVGILKFLGLKKVKSTIKTGIPGLELAKQGIDIMFDIATAAGKLGMFDIPKLLVAVAGVSITIMSFVSLMWFLSLKKVKSWVRKGITTMEKIKMSLLPLLDKFSELAKNIDYRTMLAFAIASTSLLLIMVMGVLSAGKLSIKFQKQILAGTATFGAVLATAILLKGVAENLSEASKYEINLLNMLKLTGAVLLIVGVATVIGLATAPLALAMIGIIALGVVMVQLIVITIALKAISLFKTNDLDKSKENIGKIFGACTEIILKAPMNPGTMIGLFFSAIIITEMTLITTLILVLAVELKLLSQLNLEVGVIQGKIDQIFTLVEYMQKRAVGPKDNFKKDKNGEDRSVFEAFILKTCSQVANIITAIFSMGSVVISFITVSAILLIGGALMLIAKMKIETTAIEINVNAIFDELDVLTNRISQNRKIKNNGEDKSGLKKLLTKIPIVGGIVEIADALVELGSVAMSLVVVGCISLIAKNLNSIATIKLEESTIETNVETIFKITNAIYKQIEAHKNDVAASEVNENFSKTVMQMTSLGTMIKAIEMANVEKYQKNVDNTVKLLDKANSVDVKKIKTVTDMFSKMSEFSKSIKGDFEKLAKVLNEDLLDALNELNKYLDQASKKSSSVSVQAAPVTLQGMQPVAPATPTTSTSTKSTEQPQDLGQIQQTLDSIRETIMTFTTSGIVIKDTED